MRLHGHTRTVRSVAFGPELLVSGSVDGSVIVWNLAYRQVDHRFYTPAQPVIGVAVDPAGKFVASGHSDGSVRVYDLAIGHPMAAFSAHNQAVWSVQFSADSRRLFSCGHDYQIVCYNLNTSEFAAVVRTDQTAIYRFAPLPSAAHRETIIAGLWRPFADVFDLKTGQTIRRFAGHSGPVLDVALLDASATVLTASHDGTMRIWSLETGHCLRTIVNSENRPVLSLATSLDQQRVFWASADGWIRSFDPWGATDRQGWPEWHQISASRPSAEATSEWLRSRGFPDFADARYAATHVSASPTNSAQPSPRRPVPPWLKTLRADAHTNGPIKLATNPPSRLTD